MNFSSRACDCALIEAQRNKAINLIIAVLGLEMKVSKMGGHVEAVGSG